MKLRWKIVVPVWSPEVKVEDSTEIAVAVSPSETRGYRVNAPIAQLVEQLTLNQWVQGSIPCGRTK